MLCTYLSIFKVLIFANNNSKFTRFLIGNENAFELYFKQTKCDELQEVEKLYTLQDVYNQVHLIVDSVSHAYVCMYISTYCKLGAHALMHFRDRNFKNR